MGTCFVWVVDAGKAGHQVIEQVDLQRRHHVRFLPLADVEDPLGTTGYIAMSSSVNHLQARIGRFVRTQSPRFIDVSRE